MHESISKSRQIKAARTLLDWSQEKLAQAANLSITTIRKLEAGSLPRSTTLEVVRYALEEGGLEFIEPGGVRHRMEDVIVYHGEERINSFFDDLYQVAKKNGGELVAVCPSENDLFPQSEAEAAIHAERMFVLRDRISLKCVLIKETGNLRGMAYSEYKSMQRTDIVPFIIYGDKCALIILRDGVMQKIIAIQSMTVVKTFRQQFHAIWGKAKPLRGKMEKKQKE